MIIYIGPFRESAHVHSVVIDKSQIQTSGGTPTSENKKIIVPPKPSPVPPTPVHPTIHFISLGFPITNAPLNNNLNPNNSSSDPQDWTWNYSTYNLKEAYLDIAFTNWDTYRDREKEEIQNHIENSFLVLKEGSDSDHYLFSINLLGDSSGSNAYRLYNYQEEIRINEKTTLQYGLPRNGEIVPVEIIVSFTDGKSTLKDNSYRPILSQTETEDDISVGFSHTDLLPEVIFKDYLNHVLSSQYALVVLHSDDLSKALPNNANPPTDNTYSLSDMVSAVYYLEDNNGEPYYRKIDNYTIENKKIVIDGVSDYDNVVLLLDPVKTGLKSVTGSLNVFSKENGEYQDIVNVDLTVTGTTQGSTDPFIINGNSYTDVLDSDTPFIGTNSVSPYLNGTQVQVWSIQDLKYPYTSYVNYTITGEGNPYSVNTIYTSSSPNGFDTHSGIRVIAWVADPPWKISIDGGNYQTDPFVVKTPIDGGNYQTDLFNVSYDIIGGHYQTEEFGIYSPVNGGNYQTDPFIVYTGIEGGNYQTDGFNVYSPITGGNYQTDSFNVYSPIEGGNYQTDGFNVYSPIIGGNYQTDPFNVYSPINGGNYQTDPFNVYSPINGGNYQTDPFNVYSPINGGNYETDSFIIHSDIEGGNYETEPFVVDNAIGGEYQTIEFDGIEIIEGGNYQTEEFSTYAPIVGGEYETENFLVINPIDGGEYETEEFDAEIPINGGNYQTEEFSTYAPIVGGNYETESFVVYTHLFRTDEFDIEYPIEGGNYQTEEFSVSSPISGGNYQTDFFNTSSPIIGGDYETNSFNTYSPINGGTYQTEEFSIYSPITGGNYQTDSFNVYSPISGGNYQTDPFNVSSPIIGGDYQTEEFGTYSPINGGNYQTDSFNVYSPISGGNYQTDLFNVYASINGGVYQTEEFTVNSTESVEGEYHTIEFDGIEIIEGGNYQTEEFSTYAPIVGGEYETESFIASNPIDGGEYETEEFDAEIPINGGDYQTEPFSTYAPITGGNYETESFIVYTHLFRTDEFDIEYPTEGGNYHTESFSVSSSIEGGEYITDDFSTYAPIEGGEYQTESILVNSPFPIVRTFSGSDIVQSIAPDDSFDTELPYYDNKLYIVTTDDGQGNVTLYGWEAGEEPAPSYGEDTATGSISAVTLPTEHSGSYVDAQFDSLRYYAKGTVSDKVYETSELYFGRFSQWSIATITWNDSSIGDLSGDIVVSDPSGSTIQQQSVFDIRFITSGIAGYPTGEYVVVGGYSYSSGTHSIRVYMAAGHGAWFDQPDAGRIRINYLDETTSFENLSAFDLVSVSSGTLSKDTATDRYAMYNAWDGNITVKAKYLK